MEACKSCDSLTKMFTCKECGCFMPIKIKFIKSKCPLNKW
jgi:hypothetical protein